MIAAMRQQQLNNPQMSTFQVGSGDFSDARCSVRQSVWLWRRHVWRSSLWVFAYVQTSRWYGHAYASVALWQSGADEPL